MVVNDLFEKTEKIKLKICFVSIFNTNFILILKSTKIWLENIATLFSFSEMIALRIFYHAHFFLLFFVYENENFVGFLSFEINSAPHKTKIHKIYVLPETQGTGLGRQFFELVKEKAIEKEKKKSNGYYNPKILSHIYLW